LHKGSATITAPDAALHIKAENDGTITNLLLPSNSDTEYTVANNDILVNGNYEFDIHATNSLDIRLRNSSNQVLTPTNIQHGGDHVKIELNVGTPVSGATLMKSGQTVQYKAGDDGDIEAGRAVDFTKLAIANPFGNINRFTDELGGQTYANNIVIDWSTYDGATVLGYKRTLAAATNWNGCIDNSLTVSIGTFTSGWRLANINEYMNIMNWGNGANEPLNYSPFNISTIANFATSTTRAAATSQNIQVGNSTNINISGIDKTTNQRYISVRTFTVTGTTLS